MSSPINPKVTKQNKSIYLETWDLPRWLDGATPSTSILRGVLFGFENSARKITSQINNLYLSLSHPASRWPQAYITQTSYTRPSAIEIQVSGNSLDLGWLPTSLSEVNSPYEIYQADRPVWFWEEGTLWVAGIDFVSYVFKPVSGWVDISYPLRDHPPIGSGGFYIETQTGIRSQITQDSLDFSPSSGLNVGVDDFCSVSWQSSKLASLISSNQVWLLVDNVRHDLKVRHLDGAWDDIAWIWGLTYNRPSNSYQMSDRLNQWHYSWSPQTQIAAILGQSSLSWWAPLDTSTVEVSAVSIDFNKKASTQTYFETPTVINSTVVLSKVASGYVELFWRNKFVGKYESSNGQFSLSSSYVSNSDPELLRVRYQSPLYTYTTNSTSFSLNAYSADLGTWPVIYQSSIKTTTGTKSNYTPRWYTTSSKIKTISPFL
jgi:hypothetical protein